MENHLAFEFSEEKLKKIKEFQKKILSKIKFKFFLFFQLPLAYVAGIKLNILSTTQSQVSMKYRFWNKNPFGSIYFAALSMAAELSTGAIALMAIYKEKPTISMLVVNMRAEFKKKARGIITFKCEQGRDIFQAVETCKVSQEGQILEVKSVGIDRKGEVVAVFYFTWSFKQKSK